MNFSPHNYQSYAIDYIETHPVAAVLLDMGLGKTVISLTAIADLLFDSFETHRILVVAPLRVARDTWPAEISKWQHLKHLTYAVAVGTVKERKAALSAGADITIINRENLGWLIDSSGFDFNYDMVIIDELSSFKNHKSKRFQSLMKVRPKVKRIIGLTGTPSSNGLMDLWAEFKLLDFGERLGRFITHYRNNYFIPDKRNGEIIYSYKPMPYAEDAIYRKISDITISMKSTDHLQMPELITSQYEVQLSEDEEQRYEELNGTSAVVFSVYAPNGTIVQNQSGKLTLATSAYSGTTAITSAAYQWAKYVNGTWTNISGATGSTLEVSGADIINIQSYRCTMTYSSKNYVDVITVEDKSDPYVSEMLSIGGFTVKNNLGGLVPYIIVRTNQQEVDALLGIISETAPSSPKSGDFWYKIDHSAKSVTLMKYSGSAWANATEKQSLTYTWYAQDKDGKEVTFTKTGKVIYLSAADIDSLLTLQCDVSN